jgi:hypothetical protein
MFGFMTFSKVFNKKILKSILVVFLINTTLGTIITFFTYRPGSEPFYNEFLQSQIMTHSVSSSAFIISHFLGRILLTAFSVPRFLVLIAGILLAAACGVFIGTGVIKFFFSKDITHSGIGISGIMISSLLITLIFISFLVVLGRVREKHRILERDLHNFKSVQQRTSDRHLALKDGDFHRMIDYNDLIYLSSSGRVSIVHSKDRDYEIHELLGSMEKKLPQNRFLRIHKQFVVNADFISGLRYYEGGRYNLHLSDEDETILPVGKAFTGAVKKRMKIDGARGQSLKKSYPS